MNIMLWLIIGGLAGWIASLIMGTDKQQGIFLNIAVGIVGALLGGWLIGPFLGAGSINESMTLLGFIVSVIGAVILIAVLKLLQRRSVH